MLLWLECSQEGNGHSLRYHAWYKGTDSSSSLIETLVAQSCVRIRASNNDGSGAQQRCRFIPKASVKQ